MKPITLGEVTIQRIVEIDRSSFPTTSMLPDSTPDALARHAGWLRPHFMDERTGDLRSHIQTYVVRTPKHTVLIDTGVGNDKTREGRPAWHQRQGTWLDDLAGLGIAPAQVDIVLCTHLHVDHVGWNTRWDGRGWVPTFPNARYLFVGSEWEYWRHQLDHEEHAPALRDSVLPIVEAGRADLVDERHVVDEWLRFEPSHGHTPGHACLRLTTTGGEAVFAGDLMHRTVQVAEPQWSSQFCSDMPAAARTRRAFVERHADSGVLVIPCHFPWPGHVVRRDGGFRFEVAPGLTS